MGLHRSGWQQHQRRDEDQTEERNETELLSIRLMSISYANNLNDINMCYSYKIVDLPLIIYHLILLLYAAHMSPYILSYAKEKALTNRNAVKSVICVNSRHAANV